MLLVDAGKIVGGDTELRAVIAEALAASSHLPNVEVYGYPTVDKVLRETCQMQVLVEVSTIKPHGPPAPLTLYGY